MNRFLILLFIALVFSCVQNGSGIQTISGSLSGTVPANVKIGIFAPEDLYTFTHDATNNTDKDIIFKNKIGDEIGEAVGPFSPVQVLTPEADDTYSLLLPDDPSTVSCLIAWNDVNDDDIYDFSDIAEVAYLPVKRIEGTEYVIHNFSYLEVSELITYLAVYSTMDRTAVNYDLNQYNPNQDNLDAIGAEGFNFNWD